MAATAVERKAKSVSLARRAAAVLGVACVADFAVALGAESHDAAELAWACLELVGRERAQPSVDTQPSRCADWAKIHDELASAHPHPEASGALAWLWLFGVPDTIGGLQFPFGFPRDVNRAVAIAREGTKLQSPTCGRCYTLLGLLLSVGYPPLVNAAHVVTSGLGDSPSSTVGKASLFLVGGEVTALPYGSRESSRLPRDIGRPDPAAVAYSAAAHAGDVLGTLAVSHLAHRGIIDQEKLWAPGPNRASAVTPRRPRGGDSEEISSRDGEGPSHQLPWGCDPFLTSQLGKLASVALDASREHDGWGPPAQPLSMEKAAAQDRAWLRHVLADPKGATPDALVQAAGRLDRGVMGIEHLPRGSPNAAELRQLAVDKGSAGAAMQLAIDHLKRNETAEARPLLNVAVNNADDPGEVEMARYYIRRYTCDEPDAGAAWPHLVRATELGRSEAELLVAHAHANGDVAGAPKHLANLSEAKRRYHRIAEGATSVGTLNEVQAFAAYNLGVLSLQSTTLRVDADDTGADANGQRHDDTMRSANATTSEEGSSTHSSPAADSGKAEGPQQSANGRNTPNNSGIEGAQQRRDPESTEVDAGAKSSRRQDSISGGGDSLPCSPEAQISFKNVVLSHLPLIRMGVALAQRAARLGDTVGALLLSSLMSDLGHPIGHADAASIWDSWAKLRPKHLGDHHETESAAGGATRRMEPCNLTGWWTTSTPSLASQNVSRAFVSSVEGGGFEMFNTTLEGGAAVLEGLNMSEVVIPAPARTQLRHLHSFLWHTSYDVLPDGAPVPVALQPPGAVPHLVEHHHQRGKLILDETCDMARIEAMFVNWTFHRLGAPASQKTPKQMSGDGVWARHDKAAGATSAVSDAARLSTQEFLHCWIRPEWYFSALDANLAGVRRPPPAPAPPPPQGWEALLALTTSADKCQCYGAFGCRRGDGACVTFAGLAEGACPPGSTACLEVPPHLEPPGKPMFSALPEVCALAYHRRGANAGMTDAMHVLSHAYSNGLRGVPKDAAEAFAWSKRAMDSGDARGRLDVAYSLEFGLGVEADPARAHAMYRESLRSSGEETAARASSLLALLAASGRYLAGRLLGVGGAQWRTAPWISQEVHG